MNLEYMTNEEMQEARDSALGMRDGVEYAKLSIALNVDIEELENKFLFVDGVCEALGKIAEKERNKEAYFKLIFRIEADELVEVDRGLYETGKRELNDDIETIIVNDKLCFLADAIPLYMKRVSACHNEKRRLLALYFPEKFGKQGTDPVIDNPAKDPAKLGGQFRGVVNGYLKQYLVNSKK